jgi:hypothetical protein
LRINIYRRQNGDNVTKDVINETNEGKLIALIAEIVGRIGGAFMLIILSLTAVFFV